MIRRSKKRPDKPVDPKMVEIARLLRKAVRSRDSALFCQRISDDNGCRDFTRRSEKALKDALALDPNKASPDWESVT